MNVKFDKSLKIAFFLIIIFSGFVAKSQQTITIPSTDGINITADLYFISKANAPIIILFHQARYSRGEFKETAKQFNSLGYNCIAVDLRSGDKVNGVENETYKQAKAKGLSTEYIDALPDMEKAVEYVFDKYPENDVLALGSSFSANLVFVLAAQYKNLVAVMSFSPGEYFRYKGEKFENVTPYVRCPVFITSAKKEIPLWLAMYNNLPEVFAFKFQPVKVEGQHGSKTLWKSSSGNEKYWEEVKLFLDNL